MMIVMRTMVMTIAMMIVMRMMMMGRRKLMNINACYGCNCAGMLMGYSQ